MAEQSGPSVAAIQARQAILSARYAAAVQADHVLADAVHSAHRAAATARSRLATVAAEIESVVTDHPPAMDAALSARELQKLLIAKQRELIEIVAQARRDATAGQARLSALQQEYQSS